MNTDYRQQIQTDTFHGTSSNIEKFNGIEGGKTNFLISFRSIEVQFQLAHVLEEHGHPRVAFLRFIIVQDIVDVLEAVGFHLEQLC